MHMSSILCPSDVGCHTINDLPNPCFPQRSTLVVACHCLYKNKPSQLFRQVQSLGMDERIALRALVDRWHVQGWSA